MGQLAIPLMVASSVVSAGSSILGSMYESSASKAKQRQYRHKANTERAVAQRRAIGLARDGDLAESRAVARLAASGGGGSGTPGGANLLSELNRNKHSESGTALWEGESRAQDLLYQAKLEKAQERQRKRMQVLSGIEGVLNAGSAFAGKYG
jgi:hypothetical protein